MKTERGIYVSNFISVGEQTVTFISPNDFAQLETPLLVRTGQANAGSTILLTTAGTVDETRSMDAFRLLP